MSETAWEEWTPAWAPLVQGRYERRTYGGGGMPDPQKVEMHCTHPGCGGNWKTVCASGNVRRHISTFAIQHTHRDALDAPRVVRPGSKRGPPP